MLNLIYGAPGSGKTHYSDTLILKALSDNKKAVLLVPEQEAVDTENRIYDRAMIEGVSIERLTVVSFRRLANLAFRRYGGIEYSNIGEGGRLLLLWRIIEELSPALTVYKNNRDKTLVELMLSVCTEFKRYCVTPVSLSKAIDKIKDERFKNKLTDVTLIYSAYCAQTSDENTDSSDDVNRLAEIYRTESIDADECFFVDSFNGFTLPELNVLEQLIRRNPVTITVNKPIVSGKMGFLTVEKTENQLRTMAQKLNVTVNVITTLPDKNDHEATEFTLIKDKLYDFSYHSDKEYSSDKIRFAECKDRFSECEYIASIILSHIRKGARYRDFAIITRGIEKYDGILDAVFERHGIPLFTSSRSKLTATPLYKTVTAALNVIADGFNTEDVLTLIKCGLLEISAQELDALESYVTLWNITGKRWTEEEDWFMNPLGFTDVKDARSEQLLELVNKAKRKIAEPLITLKNDLHLANVKAAANALYDYVINSGIYDYFKATVEPEDITVFNTFTSLLDTLTNVVGDIPVNALTFSSLLYLVAKNTDYGAIPSTLDRVTAGDASILRCNGVKHVFLADCENGIFPASVTDDSFFSDSEKSILFDSGIELSPCITEKNDLEAFYFLRAATEATETLTATICEKSGKAYPSVGLQRLHALFPANETVNYPDDLTELELISDKITACEVLPSLKATELYDVLKDVMIKHGIPANENTTPIADPYTTVLPETANELFGKRISLTSTRLETFVKCPFSYYCNYVLKLREKKQTYFEASDKGTYVHRILEKAVKILFDTKNPTLITDEDIENAVDSALTDVLFGILGKSKSSEGKRFEAIIYRLRRLILALTANIVSEFKNSDFRPAYFEFKIGDGGLNPFSLGQQAGLNISVYGTIDRVDTYKKGNDVYIRVVDYKTGARAHSLDNVKYGLDTQMLLYLFSILNTTDTEFLSTLGVQDGGTLRAAGVLYQPARAVTNKVDMPSEDDFKTNEAFLRSGVLSSDSELLEAMEHGLEGRFIPIKQSSGSVKASSKLTLIDNEDFDALKIEISDKLTEVAKKMKDGNACATPLSFADPCSYCSLFPICRSRQKN